MEEPTITGTFTRFKANEWCVWNHSVVYVESLISDFSRPILTSLMMLTRKQPTPRGASLRVAPILKRKGESIMVARIVEFIPKLEKKQEFVNVLPNEALPTLKKQPPFLDFLPFL